MIDVCSQTPYTYTVHIHIHIHCTYRLWLGVRVRKCFNQWHTHPFSGPFPGLPRWAGTRKVKPIWILLKQETVSGSGISWAVCKSASRSRVAGCPSCRPTNSVKALKAQSVKLQARACLSHALCASGQLAAERRRKCTRDNHVLACNLPNIHQF